MSLPERLSRRLAAVVGGPLPAWPGIVDAAAERWFSLAARVRLLIVGLAVVSLATAAVRVAQRSPWGPDVSVLVAARDLPTGHTLVPGDLLPTTRPGRTVPEDPVAPATGWIGAVTAGPLATGAVVSGAQLADDGLADLVADGRVAVAVPADLLPPLEPGGRVDLVGGGGQGGQHVARDGRVLASDGAHVWVEVDRADAAQVAAAIAWGAVTVALLGG